MTCSIDFLPTLCHDGEHDRERGRGGLRRRRPVRARRAVRGVGDRPLRRGPARSSTSPCARPRRGRCPPPPASGCTSTTTWRASRRPTWSRSPPFRGDQAVPECVVEALRAAYDRGARMLSVCTGRVRARCGGAARRPRVHHPLDVHRRARHAVPRGPGHPRGALRRRRPGDHQRRLRGGPRRLPAPVAPGVRCERGQHGRPADGGPAAARRRPGPVHPQRRCPTATPRPWGRC